MVSVIFGRRVVEIADLAGGIVGVRLVLRLALAPCPPCLAFHLESASRRSVYAATARRRSRRHAIQVIRVPRILSTEQIRFAHNCVHMVDDDGTVSRAYRVRWILTTGDFSYYLLYFSRFYLIFIFSNVIKSFFI